MSWDSLLKKVSGVKWGLDSESALTYIKASIIPTLEYGIEIIPKNKFNFFKKINNLIAKSIKIALNIPVRINNQPLLNIECKELQLCIITKL